MDFKVTLLDPSEAACLLGVTESELERRLSSGEWKKGRIIAELLDENGKPQTIKDADGIEQLVVLRTGETHEYRYLSPTEIAQEFDYSEQEVWRKLSDGKWHAATLAEYLNTNGDAISYDFAGIPAEAIRRIIGQTHDEIEVKQRWGQTVIIQAKRELVEVLVSPIFTPELFPECEPQGQKEKSRPDSLGIDTWIQKALKLADMFGNKDWSNGIRQITTRSVTDRVTMALAKDPSTHGKQGQRSDHNVRNIGLKGWKFTPPRIE